MIVAYLFATLWTIGCAVAFLWWFVETGWGLGTNWIAIILNATITLPIMILFAALPWLLIQTEQSPNLAILKKNEWVCSAAHQETTYIYVNKVLVPSTSTVCDQYSRSY